MEKKKILIVEDTKFYSDLLDESLSDLYEVKVASNGEMAIKMVDVFTPDIILLDIVLPDKDGFEVFDILKKNIFRKDIPVMFLSALKDEINEGKALEIGAIDYVKKPFKIKFLKNRIKNQLNTNEKMNKLRKEVEKFQNIENNTIKNIIKSLGVIVEYRDDDTGQHLERTKAYMKLLAIELQSKYPEELNTCKIELLSQSAILHDIGKVGIPDSILLKKGKLTDEEFEEMKFHTIKGRDMIIDIENTYGDNDFLNIAKIIAEYHHEKWDGSGYPYGLKGSEIPLFARMMAIIDVYDALTNERPYKRAFTHEEASKIIINGDNRIKPYHFDPVILDVFNRMNQEFKSINNNFK